MKKTLFFLFASVLLAACSNDSDNGAGEPQDSKKYPITFAIKPFAMSTEPLKEKATRSDDEDIFFAKYVVYNNEGTAIVAEGEDIEDIFDMDYNVNLELPVGNYKLAVLIAPGSYANAETKGMYIASNLDTDICIGLETFASRDLPLLFFKLTPFTIQAAVNEGGSIELERKNSIVNIDVEDKETCVLPAGTANIRVSWTPANLGFTIKEGKGIAYNKGGKTALSHVFSEQYFRLAVMTIWISESDQSEVKMEFLANDDTVLQEKSIKDGGWSNGYVYNTHGYLGNMNEEEPTQGFNISLGTLGEITVPF